jgi:hypothetical protein
MALLKVVKPESPTAEVGRIYEDFKKRIGMIPKPFQLTTASPGLMKLQLQCMDYFMNHPRLSAELLA